MLLLGGRIFAGLKARVIERVQPRRVHGFPKNPLVHMQDKKPNRQIAREVNLRALSQFPDSSGELLLSAAAAADAAEEGGVTERNSMPTRSSSRSMA